MHRVKQSKLVKVLAGIVLVAGFGTACNGTTDAQKKETETNQDSYAKLVAQQPGHTMAYSPTRDTINFWADTWGHPNKLSYVYLMNANGDLIGYYVLKGLPVSYCAALKPTVKEDSDSDGKILLPQPSVDGVYYSGGQCNSYYGRDATTGAYIEYTAGLGINVLLYDQPLPQQNVKPLGPTKISDIKK